MFCFFTTLNVLCGRLDFIGLEHTQLNVLSYCCASGHAVQCLAEFNTSGALQWLGTAGPTSLLERTGLAQAVQLGRSLTSPKIINITLGGKPELRHVQLVTLLISSPLCVLSGQPQWPYLIKEWHLKQTVFTDPVTGRQHNSVKVTWLKSHSGHEESHQLFVAMNSLLWHAMIPSPLLISACHLFSSCLRLV